MKSTQQYTIQELDELERIDTLRNNTICMMHELGMIIQ